MKSYRIKLLVLFNSEFENKFCKKKIKTNNSRSKPQDWLDSPAIEQNFTEEIKNVDWTPGQTEELFEAAKHKYIFRKLLHNTLSVSNWLWNYF